MSDKLWMIAVIISVFLVNCTSEKTGNNLELDLSKSIHLRSIYSNPTISANENRLFIANQIDMADAMVYVYDYDGKRLAEFGDKGKGPGEFQSVFYIGYNSKDEVLSVYDIYLWRISNFDNNYEFIDFRQLSDIFYQFTYLNDSMIYIRRSLGEEKITDYLELEKPDGSKQVLYKKELSQNIDADYLLGHFLSFDINDRYIILMDIEENKFTINHYSDDGFLIREWEPIRFRNIERLLGVFTGRDFILISSLASEDEVQYRVYDFNEEYIGIVRLENENETIRYVYDDMIFAAYENDEGEFYCNIYVLNLE